MRFAPLDAHVDCQALLDGCVAAVAGDVIRALDAHGFAVAHIGRLRLAEADSRTLAGELMREVRTTLIDDGAPGELRLEIDRPQSTYVPERASTRTLLPHHDGQHCSYLTPSRLDRPDFDPAWRTFGSSGYTTTPAHKLYQGIFIADPGTGLSVTTYYDLLAVVGDARARAGSGDGVSVADDAAWLDGNLKRARSLQEQHGCVYPSIGGLLGSAVEAHHAVSFHHAESPIPTDVLACYPELAPLLDSCPCGSCQGETARVFCHVLEAVTGHHWQSFRDRYEVLVPSERFDVVLGENITMLHGGWAGGPDRLLEPYCMVVDEPASDAYEAWLASAWRRPQRRPALSTPRVGAAR